MRIQRPCSHVRPSGPAVPACSLHYLTASARAVAHLRQVRLGDVALHDDDGVGLLVADRRLVGERPRLVASAVLRERPPGLQPLLRGARLELQRDDEQEGALVLRNHALAGHDRGAPDVVHRREERGDARHARDGEGRKLSVGRHFVFTRSPGQSTVVSSLWINYSLRTLLILIIHRKISRIYRAAIDIRSSARARQCAN
jgi:hypothetical protein